MLRWRALRLEGLGEVLEQIPEPGGGRPSAGLATPTPHCGEFGPGAALDQARAQEACSDDPDNPREPLHLGMRGAGRIEAADDLQLLRDRAVHPVAQGPGRGPGPGAGALKERLDIASDSVRGLGNAAVRIFPLEMIDFAISPGADA